MHTYHSTVDPDVVNPSLEVIGLRGELRLVFGKLVDIVCVSKPPRGGERS